MLSLFGLLVSSSNSNTFYNISLFNHNKHHNTTKEEGTISSSLVPIFVLCDICYWCSTCLDKTRLPIDNGKCPKCHTTNTLSSFPVMSNESFTFDHDDEKRGVELKFMHRKIATAIMFLSVLSFLVG